MLTSTSGINNLTGYQVQRDILSNTTGTSSLSSGDSTADQNNSVDTVEISHKAQELQQNYQKEENTLEQNYNNETQQLEREYLQERNRLRKEYSQEKQSLEINTYI